MCPRRVVASKARRAAARLEVKPSATGRVHSQGALVAWRVESDNRALRRQRRGLGREQANVAAANVAVSATSAWSCLRRCPLLFEGHKAVLPSGSESESRGCAANESILQETML